MHPVIWTYSEYKCQSLPIISLLKKTQHFQATLFLWCWCECESLSRRGVKSQEDQDSFPHFETSQHCTGGAKTENPSIELNEL